MKNFLCGILLYLIVISATGAQQHLPEMGMALRVDSTGDRLFVNHPQHPFGTRLKIINMLNNTELELNVDGKPNNNTWALIEVSSLASEFLGIPRGILNQVRIEVLAVPTTTPAMRARIGAITQTGNAVVQGNRTDLSASHPSIPIGRTVELTNTNNGIRVNVTITGRCQANVGRVIEISPPAARALGIQNSGQVRLESK